MLTIKDNCFINLEAKKIIWTSFIVVCEQLNTEGVRDIFKICKKRCIWNEWNVLESVWCFTFFISFKGPLLFCDLVDLEYLSLIWTWQSSDKSHQNKASFLPHVKHKVVFVELLWLKTKDEGLENWNRQRNCVLFRRESLKPPCYSQRWFVSVVDKIRHGKCSRGHFQQGLRSKKERKCSLSRCNEEIWELFSHIFI